MKRTLHVPAAVATLALALTSVPGTVPSAVADDPATSRAAAAPLTNLDHLDWLGDTVTPADQAGHTTYRLDEEPGIGTLWTYADRDADGSYRRVGGGAYDADTDTWGQGAFNADDMTRAAVVYLRHWQSTGSTRSRDAARQLLRGVGYLQTATGPDAGNVVLWMQPDGTLNPSAEPVELPDPSDSDASYWLARSIWAFGEGYAAFRHSDPAFAAFLSDRLGLAVDAVDRQVLDRYGDFLQIDGERTPAWLIADGADASAEAVLGLAAYVDAGGRSGARRTLARLAEGIALLGGGGAQTWPMGGIRPWALSRSIWHAWGSQMPAALARASDTLGRNRLARPAVRDSFTFTPWLLTSGGPDNGRLPTRTDLSQIAYGTDSRLQSLLATAEVTGRTGARALAGMVAAWYFGANASGEPMYDAGTGRTFDGVSGEGVINRNSGAESTIHGLLSMLLLDRHPRIARLARTATMERRVGTTTLQAEDGALTGAAEAVEPDSLWTGESLFGGTGYAALGDGGTDTITLPRHPRSLLLPVLDLRPGSTAVTQFRAQRKRLGEVRSGAVGPQGDSPAPGALLPTTLAGEVAANARRITATTRVGGTGGDPARLDAVMLEPLVSRLVLSGGAHGTALLSSAADRPRRARLRVPGRGRTVLTSYDGLGRLVARDTSRRGAVTVTVPAGGLVLARR